MHTYCRLSTMTEGRGAAEHGYQKWSHSPMLPPQGTENSNIIPRVSLRRVDSSVEIRTGQRRAQVPGVQTGTGHSGRCRVQCRRNIIYVRNS